MNHGMHEAFITLTAGGLALFLVLLTVEYGLRHGFLLGVL